MKIVSIISILFLFVGINLQAQTFEVSYESGLIKKDFTGSVILYLSKENKSPKDIFVGLEITPVFRVDVENLSSSDKVLFNDDAVSFPVELSNIERGEYYVQAVFDLDIGEANIGSSSGNLYSTPIRVNLDKDFDKVFTIQATKVIEGKTLNETEFVKELKVKSKLLSKFHGKDTYVTAAVILPNNYNEDTKATFPVVFSTSGFGGSYTYASSREKYELTGQSAIVIKLDGMCSEGHSTYANSDVNGPWGDALVKEFIPAFAKKYRTNNANFLYGHSSGGWTSLWLQINYPEVFSGAWASAPDQVDFRNYQNKNIYETENIFYDASGKLLADVTLAGRFPVISTKDFYLTENVIYRGSQMRSFDAVFGGYDDNGERIRLLKNPTGELNKAALPLWKRYDISLLLRENWDQYKDAVNGKIRISIGTGDNFHLHHAVRLLETEMKEFNADLEIEYYPGDHFTIFTEEYRQEGVDFLSKCYENWLEEKK